MFDHQVGESRDAATAAKAFEGTCFAEANRSILRQPKMTHFAFMTGETILQLSTIGPWTITYVHPEDDPRKKAK